jgi:hypothetical protein
MAYVKIREFLAKNGLMAKQTTAARAPRQRPWSSTGLPYGVCRYASAHASLRVIIAAGSVKPFSATSRSSAATQ